MLPLVGGLEGEEEEVPIHSEREMRNRHRGRSCHMRFTPSPVAPSLLLFFFDLFIETTSAMIFQCSKRNVHIWRQLMV